MAGFMTDEMQRWTDGMLSDDEVELLKQTYVHLDSGLKYGELFKACAPSKEDIYMTVRGPHKVFLNKLKAEDFQPGRTAETLAHEHRFGGNYGPYSVAQHAVLVAETVARLGGTYDQQFGALHHDDSEMITGDLPQPVKARIPDFRAFEDELDAVIAERYATDVHDALIKEADRIVFCAEVRCIVPEEAQSFYGDYGDPSYRRHLQPSWTDMILWSADEAWKRYMQLHDDLEGKRFSDE